MAVTIFDGTLSAGAVSTSVALPGATTYTVQVTNGGLAFEVSNDGINFVAPPTASIGGVPSYKVLQFPVGYMRAVNPGTSDVVGAISVANP